MERERLVEIILETQGDYGWTCERAADLILSELAKEPAPVRLVEELIAYANYLHQHDVEEFQQAIADKIKKILARHEARKEVVLGDGHLVQFIDQTGRPSYFCARRHEGKRGKLIFVEEDSK